MSRWSCAPWPGPGASLVINLVIRLVISLVISLQWSAPPADSPCSPRYYYTGDSSNITPEKHWVQKIFSFRLNTCCVITVLTLVSASVHPSVPVCGPSVQPGRGKELRPEHHLQPGLPGDRGPGGQEIPQRGGAPGGGGPHRPGGRPQHQRRPVTGE